MIASGVGAPVHGREVVDILSVTNKIFISMLITTVQLTGEAAHESHKAMNTLTAKTDISVSREF